MLRWQMTAAVLAVYQYILPFRDAPISNQQLGMFNLFSIVSTSWILCFIYEDCVCMCNVLCFLFQFICSVLKETLRHWKTYQSFLQIPFQCCFIQCSEQITFQEFFFVHFCNLDLEMVVKKCLIKRIPLFPLILIKNYDLTRI